MTTIAKKFPKSKGWITAKITLKKNAIFTKQDAREFISFGKPHRCQFGLVDVSRNPIRIIYRETNKAALDPDSNPVESPMSLDAPVPFIARCGKVVVEVKEVIKEFDPLMMITAEILAGKHFNDAGDYGPGDTVNIGPLTEYWRILTFPDLTAETQPQAD